MTKYIFIPIILILSNIFVWTNVYSYESRKGSFEMDVLNIGQGDSILIKTPGNHYGLIDTGRDSKVLSELSQTLPLGRTYLDFVILTHPDADHIGGVDDILENYKVNALFFNKNIKTNELLDEIKSKIEETNTKNYSIDMFNDFTLDGIYFDVIWPQDHAKTYTFDNSNDISTSILIKYDGYKILSSGDLPSDFEAPSLADLPPEDVDIDFLKVSHHGSRFSTNLDFLKQIKPEYAFISVGAGNTYGHPTDEVLSNLEAEHSNVLRTDKDGRISLVIKGNVADISTLDSNKKFEITK
ncbi:MAG: ComEC/Rec2 family competence protein [Candidatus Dojkabacteria bacterium]